MMCSIETRHFGAYRKMIKESARSSKGLSVLKAYNIALEYLECEEEAMKLLTSELCRFNKSEINKAIYDNNYYHKNKENKA